MTKLLLNEKKSKDKVNINLNLNVSLERNSKLLPSSDFITTLSQMDVYDRERKNSNKIRLTITIYPYCTNVLFNNMTEIVNEDYTKRLTNTAKATDSAIIYKDDSFTLHDAVRDTQLSNDKCKWNYFCGLNIFNNHILRSNTFKAVCPLENIDEKAPEFNTIQDLMREWDGKQVKGYSDANIDQQEPSIDLHLYLRENIDSFQAAITNKLKDKNGWLGFTNAATIETYDKNGSLGINKVINSAKSCEFIYMYPTPDLYYFTPKYNINKNRYEKNWNYCLTYPYRDSRSDEDQGKFEDFLNQKNNSLKLIYYEEKNNNIICYSIAKHGLNVGDKVNLYKDNENSSELTIENAEVISLGDVNQKNKKYVFTIKNNGILLSSKWKEITKEEYEQGFIEIDNNHLTISKNNTKVGNTYYIINNKVNLDDSALSFSFKKCINNAPVEYYVRYFSKIPNWKFSDRMINEKVIYENDGNEDSIYNSYVLDYLEKSHDFQNVNATMAYAKTIYNDDVSQIVFTDDIDLSYLHDNLGRPLHEIFLTIMKNNKGYKQWYGIQEASRINDGEIEYSHAFGKVTSAFELSKYSLCNNNIKNILLLHNLDGGIEGYGEIDYNSNEITEFIGDLCYYSPSTAEEFSIQKICYRFNTAQRELKEGDEAYSIFRELIYDEIITDDYDADGFKVKDDNVFDNVCQRKEGYYYQAHYPIQIHTFSELQSAYPRTYKILQINGSTIIVDRTFNSEKYDKCYLYNISNGNVDEFQVEEVVGIKSFKPNKSLSINDNIKNYRILAPDKYTVPKFAKMMNDGSCRFAWRDLIINGYDANSNIEEYPFTNGAFYVNKRINFYLHRQDPFDDIKNYTSNGQTLKSTSFPFDYEGKVLLDEKMNNYYNEKDILC